MWIDCWHNENRESEAKITYLYTDAPRVPKNTQTNRAKRGFRSRNVGKTITNCFSSEKWKILTKDAWDDFDNTGKNLFPMLKKEVRNQKSS